MIRTISSLTLLVCIIYALYNSWADYSEWQKVSFQALKSVLANKKKDLLSKKAEVARGEEYKAKRDLKLAEREKFVEEFRKSAEKLPVESPKMPLLVSSLAQAATKVGIKILSIRPEAERAGPVLTNVPIDIRLQGTYVQVMSFMDSISDLKRVISADSVTMESPVSRGSIKVVSSNITLLAPYLTSNVVSSLPQAAPTVDSEKAKEAGQ